MDPEKQNEGLFPQLPEALDALTDTELGDLHAAHRDAIARIKAKDAEFLGERDGAAIIAELEAGVDAKLQLDAELAARAESLATFEADVEALAEKAGVTDDEAEVVAEGDGEGSGDGEGEGDGEGDAEAAPAEVVAEVEVEPVADAPVEGEPVEAVEVEPVAEAEPVLADASPKAKRYPTSLAPPAPSAERRPRAKESDEMSPPALVAAGEGAKPGSELDRIDFAKAMIEVARRRGAPRRHANGSEERILVASADFPYPEERWLREGDFAGNSRKIAEIGNPFLGADSLEVLTAAGGFCAPFTPFYSLPQFATRKRPVREALPSFRADRGGVTVPTPSTIGDITTAITVIEADEDALGGTFATKSCQDFDCPPFTDVAVGIISHCREYGNLNAIAWPESVAHENDLTMAAHSRTADGRLLQLIDALSIGPVDGGVVYGAVSTLLYRLSLERDGIISRLRMDENTRFDVILPFWLATMLTLDITNGQFDRFSMATRAKVSSLLSSYGFDVSWHIDESLAVGAPNEIAAAQAAGAQNGWPGGTEIRARLFTKGALLHLDMGTLELGLVRDSTLNETNDYQMFGETFESVARIGPEDSVHVLDITLCPDGRVAAPEATEFTCS